MQFYPVSRLGDAPLSSNWEQEEEERATPPLWGEARYEWLIRSAATAQRVTSGEVC